MSSWITVPFQVDTPMFLGGANQECDPQAQFIPSLRGALRFWFRALVGPAYGENTQGLAEAETMVFGWAAEDGKPWGSSAIRLRLESAPELYAVPKRPPPREINNETPKCFPTWAGREQRQTRDYFGVTYLLGPGLWHRTCGLMRGFIEPGPGVFSVSCPDSHKEILACCLWALNHFGGLGSRSRKGFGSISLRSESAGLDLAEFPSGDGWSALATRAQTIVSALTRSQLSPQPYVVEQLPSYPRFQNGVVLRPGSDPNSDLIAEDIVRFFQTTDSWGSWSKALGQMGQRWRFLRTEPNDNQKEYSPLVETPEWREVFVDCETDEFAVGALGLPIIYGHAEPRIQVNLEDATGREMRLPSPVRFRVCETSPGVVRPSVLSLACNSVPDGAALKATQAGKQPRTLALTEALTLWQIKMAMKALNQPAAWLQEDWPNGAR